LARDIDLGSVLLGPGNGALEHIHVTDDGDAARFAQACDPAMP
jgi:hypothetical protein